MVESNQIDLIANKMIDAVEIEFQSMTLRTKNFEETQGMIISEQMGQNVDDSND